MYHVGQTSAAPARQPGESRWAWWVLPVLGEIVGDRIAAGEFRPMLFLPHRRWPTERRGVVGGMVGALAGVVAAVAITRGDFSSIPPEVI